MNRITQDSLVDVAFRLNWNSAEAAHHEYFYTKVNLWRDILPMNLKNQLLGCTIGDQIDIHLAPGSDMPAYDDSKRKQLHINQFNHCHAPRYGRYYPRGVLKDLTNIFSENIQPFRCAGVDQNLFLADFNHPLSSKDLTLTAIVHDSMIKPYDRGGECADVLECITDGPGMQIRQNGRSTDFFYEHCFQREDNAEDCLFYQRPRLVNHIDDQAVKTVSQIYGSLIQPGMEVLDLMSSWRSHIPASIQLKSLVGLGMNSLEMAENPQLTGHLVYDINSNSRLPFDDDSFDGVICTVSVEYMTRPIEVFREVARILRKDGMFVLTFSNRWFPPKVIRLWTELHEFERIGLVLEYFHQSNGFKDLETFSARGWPRPETDKYYPQMKKSDPVYAVWGRASK